jgi:hypothetical protein
MQIGFDLDNISMGELRLKKSTGKMAFSKEAFELKQGKIWPKTGELLLDGSYKFEARDYELNFSGKELRLEDFKNEVLEGPLSFKGNLYGRVLPEAPIKGLSGSFEINSENGKILKAVGGFKKVLQAINLSLPTGDDKGLPFDFLGAECNIKNGTLFIKNFKMISPALKIFATGKVDLAEKSINAEVMVIPLGVTDWVLHSLNDLAKSSQLENSNKGMISKTMNMIPILGDTLAGSEDKQGLLDGVLKLVPLIGDKKEEDEQKASLLKIYFSVDGIIGKPNVYFLSDKTSLLK